MVAWLNGGLVDEVRIDSSDRGFALGDGLFETLRVSDGRPCRVGLHLERLRAGAGVLDLPLPFLEPALVAGMAALIAVTGLDQGVLRLTVTRGPGPRGVLPPATVHPTVLMMMAPGSGPLPAARLVVALGTRRNEHSPLSRIKSLNYLDNILARQEAARRGADDAVLLNTAGRVAETSIATLFVRLGDRVVTPPVAEGALPGIARHVILTASAAREQLLTVGDLAQAREMVLTSSLGVRRVAVFEGEPLPGEDGLFRNLQRIMMG